MTNANSNARVTGRLTMSRRTLLRGALGGTSVAVALPPLEAMLDTNGTAYADGTAIPTRMGVFFFGDGVRLNRWTPAETGPAWALTPELEPLMPVKEYCSVVSGMSIKTGNQRVHHAGAVGILSGAPMIQQPHPNSGYRSTFSKPSIDQVAAAELGKTTRFKSLEVGLSKLLTAAEGTTLQYLSHNGPDSPNPPEYDPAKVYDRLFGTGFQAPSGAASPQVAAKTIALRKSVIDAVMADLNALEGRVGAADRARLGQHLANIRTIENQLSTGVSGSASSLSCKVPVNPGSFAAENSREQLEPITKAMSELVAIALACDQTRVFSMMFSGGVSKTVFWQVNATQGRHSMSHTEGADQPLMHASTVFTMKMFSTLLQSLKSVSVGAGNLLDHSVVLCSSDVAEGKSHSSNDFPIVVAGGGGGRLKKPGVHYRSKGENTSMVLLSVLRAAGLPLAEFGTGGGRVTESCTAIEV